MRIDDLRRTFDIHESVVALVNQVETETGKPVEVRIDHAMETPATVKIARSRMSYHLIKLHPQQAAVAGYLVANKCANILRVMREAPEDRMAPITNDSTMKTAFTAIEQGSRRNEPPYSPKLLRFWIGGIITQLMNLPVQSRIEQWVHESMPALRDEQRKYLEADIKQTIAGVSLEVERVTPRIVFETSNAMTYTFVRSVGELLGANYTQRYNDYREIMRRGKDLYAMVRPEDGRWATDVKIVNEWAVYLDIGGWFVWTDFEEMPESYYADVGG